MGWILLVAVAPEANYVVSQKAIGHPIVIGLLENWTIPLVIMVRAYIANVEIYMVLNVVNVPLDWWELVASVLLVLRPVLRLVVKVMVVGELAVMPMMELRGRSPLFLLTATIEP